MSEQVTYVRTCIYEVGYQNNVGILLKLPYMFQYEDILYLTSLTVYNLLFVNASCVSE